MSVARKKKTYDQSIFPGATDAQQSRLRLDKAAAEQLREKLQSSILEHPKTARKAALLISLWVAGKSTKRSKK